MLTVKRSFLYFLMSFCCYCCYCTKKHKLSIIGMRANISAGPLGTKLLGYRCIKKLVYKIDFHNKKQVIFSQKRETKNNFFFTKTIYYPFYNFFKKILGYYLINIRQTLWTNAHKKKM